MDALASSDALVLASATVLCASVVGLIAVRAASNATGKDGTMTTASWFGALGRGRAPATAKETFDDAGKVRLSVFYGTQTGTSERYAREVVAHARARCLRLRYANAHARAGRRNACLSIPLRNVSKRYTQLCQNARRGTKLAREQL